jgi:hypothetical protein
VLGYATTIAGAQGRTVDRGHVVVTPRTTSASLYVGMSRGREANHAHVVCDSHDHAEFELGDLTGEQAFAAATQREPDGQLSAHTIQQRWEAGRVDRTAARAGDRARRQVTDWWAKRQLGLPPSMQTAIASRHREILDVLYRLPNNSARKAVIRSAASSVDWRTSDAADRFVGRLQHLSTRSRTVETMHTPGRSNAYER